MSSNAFKALKSVMRWNTKNIKIFMTSLMATANGDIKLQKVNHKHHTLVNFINILRAAFAPIFLRQKNKY